MLLTNTARNTNWMVSFTAKLPGNYSVDVTDWIQSISIPDVTASAATTNYGGTFAKMYGETPEHGSLTVTYLLDEHWELLTILYGSLYQATRNSQPETVFSDMVIFGLDTYNTPKFKLELNKIVITNISGFDLTTSVEDSPLTITATYEYSIHRFKKISVEGKYGIGTGPFTMGMFLSDGTPTSDNLMNDAKYRTYYGKLFNSGILTNDQMKKIGVPQPIKLACRQPIVVDSTRNGAYPLLDEFGNPILDINGNPIYLLGQWKRVPCDTEDSFVLKYLDNSEILDKDGNQICVVWNYELDPTGGYLTDEYGKILMSNGLWSVSLLENDYYSIFGANSKVDDITKVCGVS